MGKVKIQKSKKINYLDYKPKDKSAELDYTGNTVVLTANEGLGLSQVHLFSGRKVCDKEN